jgi:hypothetical protein
LRLAGLFVGVAALLADPEGRHLVRAISQLISHSGSTIAAAFQQTGENSSNE